MTKCAQCSNCDHDKIAKKNKGLCPIIKGSDGLPVMCVGKWVNDKHNYLTEYFDRVFTKTKISKKWGGNLYYIDLFAGPGRCFVRESGKEVDGSPLVALKYDFKKYYFVDKNPEALDALKKRCTNKLDKIEFFMGDSNVVVEAINKNIPQASLSEAFIDPYGLNFKFSSYEKLVKGRKVDLIINFPIGTAIKRNYKRKNFSPELLDEFLGGAEWRKDPRLDTHPQECMMAYFKGNLNKVDQNGEYNYETYDDVLFGDPQMVNGIRVLMYNLFYASRSPIGRKMWQLGTKYNPSGQQSIF